MDWVKDITRMQRLTWGDKQARRCSGTHLHTSSERHARGASAATSATVLPLRIPPASTTIWPTWKSTHTSHLSYGKLHKTYHLLILIQPSRRRRGQEGPRDPLQLDHQGEAALCASGDDQGRASRDVQVQQIQDSLHQPARAGRHQEHSLQVRSSDRLVPRTSRASYWQHQGLLSAQGTLPTYIRPCTLL